MSIAITLPNFTMSGVPYADADNKSTGVANAQSIKKLSDQIGDTSYDLHNNLYIVDTNSKKSDYIDLWTSISTLEDGALFEQVETPDGVENTPTTNFPIGTTKKDFPTGFIVYPTDPNLTAYIITNKNISDLVVTGNGTTIIPSPRSRAASGVNLVGGRMFQIALNYYDTGFTYQSLFEFSPSNAIDITAELLAMNATVVNRAAQMIATPQLNLTKLDQQVASDGYQFVIFKQTGDDGKSKFFDTPGLRIGGGTLVNKIKTTCADLLADSINAPITCQALLESANCSVITGTALDPGYHTLPPSGKIIHDYIESALSNLLRKPARYVNTTKTDVNSSTSFNVFDKWKNDSTALGIGDTTANCVVSFGPDNNTSGHVTSFKVLINGYYRFTNTMCYSLPGSTVSTALNIKTRFSRSFSGTTSSSWSNFGPQGARGPGVVLPC